MARKFWHLFFIVPFLMVAGCSTAQKTSIGEGIDPSSLTPTEWVSLGKPGEAHRLLDTFVGEWDVEETSWSAPKATPEKSEGFSKASWVLGGRFVRERFKGLAGGEVIEGMGFMGYDSGANHYTTVWMDSLNTSVAVSKGTYNPATRTFEMIGEVYDPLLGAFKETRTNIQIVSTDVYKLWMLDTAPTGERFKSMEIVYRRRPAN